MLIDSVPAMDGSPSVQPCQDLSVLSEIDEMNHVRPLAIKTRLVDIKLGEL
jgi:hypothetical protein